MKLSKEQKNKFFSKMGLGDSWGLEYLQGLVNDSKDGSEELEELVYCVMRLNYMNDICECERWDTFRKFRPQITNLYFEMKNELLEAVGITDEDLEEV